MNIAIQILLQVGPPDCSIGPMKPVLVPCACGKWQAHMVFADDSILYGSVVYETKQALAEVLADVLIELGIETRTIN